MVKKLLTQIKHKTLTGEEVVMDIGAKASNVLPENFVEQKERSNLAAKDKLPVIFGKLSKWYTDLKAVAWSGSYLDLTNKPSIPEGSAANYQVANNDTTEAEGFVADARIVRTHGLEIDGLSRDLQNKMSKYYGSVTLSEANEKAVLKYLLLDVDLMSKYGNCNFSVIVNSAQFYSGTMYSDGGVTAWGQIQQRNSDNAPGSLYSFYYNRGADPVLKKLGSAPADMLIKATNTTYKATEEEDVLVIWEHSGRCRTQKHPTPHSTFTIIAAGITKVTSVLKGNGGDYQYSAAGNYFVQHLSAGQTITCSLSEDDFSSRYRMYVIKATL